MQVGGLVQWSDFDDMRKERDEWKANHADAKARLDELRATLDELLAENLELKARAEKAERERDKLQLRYGALEIEANGMRECLAKFTDGGMSGAEVRAARDDAADKFERWAAVRLAASSGDFRDVKSAIGIAADLRSHYFPAKEQGK